MLSLINDFMYMLLNGCRLTSDKLLRGGCRPRYFILSRTVARMRVMGVLGIRFMWDGLSCNVQVGLLVELYRCRAGS